MPNAKLFILCVVLVFLCSLFFVLGILGIDAHRDPSEMDTIAYLSTALEIRQLGPAGFLSACLNGSYREANRHPLYMMLIAPVTAHTIASFVTVKKLTFLIGIIFVIVFYAGAYRLFGLVRAAVATGLLIFNATFLSLSTMVACEVLMMIFLFLGWFLTVLGFRRRIFWVGAGAAAALAYLSKSVAFLAIPIFIVATAWQCRRGLRRLVTDKYFLGFFIAFFVVASPYLIRNMKAYHDPFYSVNTRYLFIDNWQEIYGPDFDRRSLTLGIYLAKHSIGGVISRVAAGVFTRGPKLLAESLKPLPIWQKDAPQQLITGTTVASPFLIASAMIGFALFGLFRRRREDDFMISVLWLGIVYIFVGWYSKIMLGTRLMVPITPFIFMYAAEGMCSCAAFVCDAKKIALSYRRFAAAGVLVLFVLLSGVMLRVNNQWDTVDVQHSYSFPRNFNYLLTWIRQNVKPQQRYFINGHLSGLFFFFEQLDEGTPQEWPNVDSLDTLKKYIKDNNVSYGILNLPSFLYRFQVFKGYFGFTKEQGLIPLRKIDGFVPIAADTPPRSFIVIRFEPNEL